MLKLTAMFYIIVSPVLAGGLITAVLSMPGAGAQKVAMAAAAGFILALPVSWLIARNVNTKTIK